MAPIWWVDYPWLLCQQRTTGCPNPTWPIMAIILQHCLKQYHRVQSTLGLPVWILVQAPIFGIPLSSRILYNQNLRESHDMEGIHLTNRFQNTTFAEEWSGIEPGFPECQQLQETAIFAKKINKTNKHLLTKINDHCYNV